MSELSHAIAALCYLYGEFDGLVAQRHALNAKIQEIFTNIREREAIVSLLGGDRVQLQVDLDSAMDAAASSPD